MTDFSLRITDWYRRNRRELPWRDTQNPYFIWLSEIIMQQTRVAQGLDYYLKFIENYPTIQDLAKADEQEVLRLWQGLGYYSRARNLHFAAKTVVNEFDGVFPDNYKDILSLKGVGEYTASAISSFAYDLPHPVVDGNVFRVLSRYFGEGTPIDTTAGKKVFKEKAEFVFDSKNPAEHNQAIMEFGAIVCTPKSPSCSSCVLQESCLGLRQGDLLDLPKKAKKTKVTKRYFEYFSPNGKDFVWLSKREEKDIWQHLFEFPKIELSNFLNEKEVLEKAKDEHGIQEIEYAGEIKHILSHQHIFARFWKVNPEALGKFKKVSLIEIDNYPISRLIDKFLESQADYKARG